jgi:hypothetical protein
VCVCVELIVVDLNKQKFRFIIVAFIHIVNYVCGMYLMHVISELSTRL